MEERTDKINGLVGFGYSGEIGDEGNKGRNILFSEICYGDYTIEENGFVNIPFLSDDRKYIKFPSEVAAIAKSGDVVIATGDGGTKVHLLLSISIYDVPELRVKDDAEFGIDIDVLPKYQYSVAVYKEYIEDKAYLCLHHSMSIDNIENAEVYGIIDGKQITFKEYNKTVFSEKTDIDITDGREVNIMIFMKYKITPYKIIKSLLYETTY